MIDLSGNRRPLVRAISKGEASFLQRLKVNESIKRTLETGVANGLSALPIAEAVNITDGYHIGVDPYQHVEHNETALALLDEFGLGDRFQLMDGPSHIELPNFMAADDRFELVFVDGMHLFGYKLADVFLTDILMAVGSSSTPS